MRQKYALSTLMMVTLLVSTLSMAQVHSVPGIAHSATAMYAAFQSGQVSPQQQAVLLKGQAVTLLPSGQILLTGGFGQNGNPVANAYLADSSGNVTQLFPGLNIARAGHTATVLPDGTVLIFGGVDANGNVIQQLEIFNPTSNTFNQLAESLLVPRAFHTATLLTDGRVVMIGGIEKGNVFPTDIQFWDYRSGLAEAYSAGLITPRENQTATLISDGTVFISGGTDHFGNQVTSDEVYDPAAHTFSAVPQNPENSTDATSAPVIAASFPANGDSAVPIQNPLVLRFTKLMDVTKITASNITLATASGSSVFGTVAAAESGRLAFFVPVSPLQPATNYVLTISNLADPAGNALPATTISFQTVSLEGDGSDEGWTPGPSAFAGQWTSGTGLSPWQKLPPLQAAPGVTALAGQVLRLNGKPLQNVTLEIDGNKTRSDSTGRFLLVNLAPGYHVLIINGETADRNNLHYGLYEVRIKVAQGKTTALNYTIWMTKLDMQHAVDIPSPTVAQDTVITTPVLPGLQLHIPANTTIVGHDGKPVKQISITAIPVDKAPFPLPQGVNVSFYFTIQPGGSYIDVRSAGTGPKGARLFYPNSYGYKPGTSFNFWNYDPDSKGWYVYGKGTVNPSGESIVPDPGVLIYQLTGAMVTSPNNAGGTGPYGCPICDYSADPVNLSSGTYSYTNTDLAITDVMPIELTRTYRNSDETERSFGISTTLNYDMFLVGDTNPWTYFELILPSGQPIQFNRISGGTGFADAIFLSTMSDNEYYGATISWDQSAFNGMGSWIMTLKNGTIYNFPQNDPNNAATPFGGQNPICGGLIGISDRYGNTIKIDRNVATCVITKITSPFGRYITLQSDSQARIIQATDNIGRTVQYTYDALGRLSTVTDVMGGVTSYTYDDDNNLLTLTDPRNILKTQNFYDSKGRVIEQIEADGGTYFYNWTPSNNSQQVFTATGSVPPTAGALAFRSCTDCSEGYTNILDAVQVTDPRGYIRSVQFNSYGMITSDTYALNQPEQETTTYTYTNDNLIQSDTNPLGRTTSYTYDANANLLTRTILSGTSQAVTTSSTYSSAFSEPTSTTDPLGNTTMFTYDALGNLTVITDPLQNQLVMAYDSMGRIVSITDALGEESTLQYHGPDLYSKTDPLGNTTTFEHDDAGRAVRITDALLNKATKQYNNVNLVTATIDPVGSHVSYTYDADGNMLSLTDAMNHVTTYTYDNMNRVVAHEDPLLRTEAFSYDSKGNLISAVDRKGQVTTLNYDGLDRKVFTGFGTTDSSGVVAYQSMINYTYDAGDRLIQTIDSIAGSIADAYDSFDRLTSEVTPQGAISYTYNTDNRRTGMKVAGQPEISYSYDNNGRLIQITQGASLIAFDYDNVGRRTSLTLSNGVSVDYSYDANSRPTNINYMYGSMVLGNLTYAYDQLGRRVHSGGAFGQTGLSSAVASTSYDAANELINWNGTAISYDSNGNMLNDGSHNFTWDARNHVSNINGVGLQYDAFGRRIENLTGTSFLYDGTNSVQELSGGVVTANSTTGDTDEVFTRADSVGTFTPLQDAQEDTIALVDNQGNIETTYSYDPFGSTSISGPFDTNPIQFTGRENDLNGLYYYRARYYNPGFGRFISEDPMGFAADTNAYRYASGDPIDFIDPSGYGPFGVIDSIVNWIKGEPPPPPAVVVTPPGLPSGVATIKYFNGAPHLCDKVEQELLKEIGAPGVLSISVGYTTNGVHSINSNHYKGLAADLDYINGVKANQDQYDNNLAMNALIDELVDYANNSGSHEVFAPGAQIYKDGDPYVASTPSKQNDLIQLHTTHVHITVAKSCGCE